MLELDHLYGIILISFIISIVCCLSGLISFTFITKYTKYLKLKFGNENIPAELAKRGYQLSVFSFAIGIFFIYRIGYVVSLNKDFDVPDWLMYDVLIALYLLLNNLFIVYVFSVRKKLEKCLLSDQDSV